LLRALYGQLVYLYIGADEERLARMRDSVLALTRGWEQSRVRAIVEETLAEVVDPIVYDEALDLIARHRAEGRLVYIVSASPDEIVSPLARHLDVDEYLATTSKIDGEGRYTGETDFYCYGSNKAEAIRREAAKRDIDLSGSYSYSDSVTDVPMLECVGHPVAVNPDRELARVAQEREWPIAIFERNVRLRDRVPMPSKGQTTAAGGVVATAALGGAAVWWWLHRRPPVRATARVPALGGSFGRVGRVFGQTSRVSRDVARIRRRGPSWPRKLRARQQRSGATASSWASIIRRSMPARSGPARR
jgi:HAD superfamily hydrolase (TIGR01490 family)